jgi:hypothetical protein
MPRSCARAPLTGKVLTFEAPPPADFEALVATLRERAKHVHA